MTQREQIPASVEMPKPPSRRIDAVDKARSMMQAVPPKPEERAEERGASPITKLTTRLPTEQVEWLKGQAKQYRERNPRRPRVTLEELLSVAIDHLREAKSLDAVIAKHRS